MQIYCENGYFPECHFTIYKQWRNRQIASYYKNLTKLLWEQHIQLDRETYFLLHEKRFNFYSFCIYIESDEKFTIADLEKQLEDKKIEVFEFTKWYKFLSYFVDRIFINGEESDFLFAKQWKIFFRLNMMYLDNDTCSLMERFFWKKIYENKNFNIFPRSFFVQQFLKDELKRESYYLLDIKDEVTTLITVEWWFYKWIESVNLWLSVLKEIYKDNEIIQFYTINHWDPSISYFTEQTIQKSMWFFTGMLTKRISQYLKEGSDIILLWDISSNYYFQESFKEWYQQHINWFILPFIHSQWLATYNTKRSSNDLYALTLINKKTPEV